MKRYIIIVILASMFISAFALAQTKGMIKVFDKRMNQEREIKVYNNSYAVCIGINDYKYWPKLNCAVADAEEMKKEFIKQGFNEVKLIKNEEASRNNILSAIAWLGKIASKDDRVVIYYSGHGHTVEGRNKKALGYIIPVDCPESDNDQDYYVNAISMNNLKEATDQINAKHIIYVMDSCFSGIALIKGDDNKDFLVEMTKDPCVYMITAGKAGEYSYETGGHGIFTRRFLRGLNGEADYDKNGVVSATELGLYTSKWVFQDAQDISKKQTPQYGRLDGEGEVVFMPESDNADDSSGGEVDFTSSLYVDSQPSGASVFIDGTERGKTPCTIKIDAGGTGQRQIIVSVSIDGYKTMGKQIALTRGKTTRWSDIRLLPEDSKIPTIEPEQASPAQSAKIGKDGAKMVLIPAGDFEMGTNQSDIPGFVQWAKKWYSGAQTSWYEDEIPRHTVYADAFYMDVYEVTNAQYKTFMDATGHKAPAYWNDSKYNDPKQPVVGVSWDDAKAYAVWAGKRLPTEAEWEKAARGGLVGKKFPWGDADPNGTQCNFADKNSSYDRADKSVDDGYQYTAPVGKYTPNGYGLYDMAGNVWEWCADWYDKGYYSGSDRRNPNGPSSGSSRVLRGGSWLINPSYIRVSYRYDNDPSDMDNNVGFRCVGL